jgi:hypothetical protein
MRPPVPYQTALPFLVGVAATAGLYLLIGLLGQGTTIHAFFFRSWYVQALTTWLFVAAVGFVVLRYLRLRHEQRILDTKVRIERLETISPQVARELLDVVPADYRGSIGFRRIDQLLRGYLHGGDVILLNQELSRRDVEQIETGHLVLNALRQLIPILGFLGTVVGLSLGMVRFPEISSSSQDIETLRSILKDFAASLSIAFDTTLLALSYSVVVVLIAAVLRHREESFIGDVEDKARQLVARLRPVGSPPEAVTDARAADLRDLAAQFHTRLEQVLHDELSRWLTAWQAEVIDSMKASLAQIATQHGAAASLVHEGVRQNGDRLLQKLDELKAALQLAQSYRVIVQPARGERHE